MKLLLTYAVALPLIICGHPDAHASLEQGYDAFEQGDVDAAVHIWRTLAEQGDATAQFNLGQLYHLGNGVAIDNREALKWYIMAAQSGNVPALYNLKLMYEEGRISREDIDVLLEFASVESQSTPSSPPVAIDTENTALQQLAPENYLLQLIATVDRTEMDQYIEFHRSALRQQQVRVVQIQNKGKAWYVLLLGPFSGHKSARSALDDLPEAVRKNGPWIRQVSSVQAVAGAAPD